ncbi:MAG: division/cell wall cluster transcriptional repressor MraZ [Lachnospiraceae bacterium]|nr:division/cell wall cluster transcriptional repressor MraZ [Lachnospiraceae bacterium]
MFKGEYNHTIDTKGRLIIPAKFRELLGEEFTITKGLDGCLFIYSNEDWAEFEAGLRALPPNKDSRMLVRFFSAGAADVEVDKQGRILIPSNLREFAELDKDVVLAGVAGRIEVWSKERWEEQKYDNMDDIAEQMAELGLSI